MCYVYTAAFAFPYPIFVPPRAPQLVRNPPQQGNVGVLVLSPTRELAMQIHTETEKLLRFQRMSVQVCMCVRVCPGVGASGRQAPL